jgi:4-amino-4-deoxy-L-arabinose transferase-like glycosyltransferase
MSRTSSPQPAVFWALAAITAAGAVLRLYAIDAQSLWHDEAISLTVARAPIGDLPGFFRAEPGGLPFEYNPPVYSYLLHLWLAVVGFGDTQARLLSAIAGTAAIPLVFDLTRRLYDDRAGLAAALLLAVSQLGVMYGQEARHYAVFLCFVLVTAWCYWQAFTTRRLAAWCACTVSAVLMVGTQYYGVFVIGALAIFTAISWRPFPWRWVAGSAVVGAAAIVPWLRFALAGQLSAASDRVQPEYFRFGLSTAASTIGRFSNGAVDGLLNSTPLWTFTVVAALFGVPLAWLVARAATARLGAAAGERRATVFALLLWAVPLGAVFTLGAALNVQYNVRYAAFCIAAYYVLVGAGATRLARPWRTIVIVAIVAYSGLSLRANYAVPYKENYRDAVALFTREAAPDDCVAFVPFGGQPLQWSLYGAPPPARRLTLQPAAGEAPCPRLWVVTYHRVRNAGHDRWRARLEPLTASLVRAVDERFHWVRVERYDAIRRQE